VNAAERRRVALHEAGHAVADVVFGRGVEYASARAGRTFAGLTLAAPGPAGATDGFDPFLFVVQQPAACRDHVERTVISLMAGDLAELFLVSEPVNAYSDDQAEQIARTALEGLGPRLAELVAKHEDREEPTPTDHEQAFSLAAAFVGPDPVAVGNYLAWLRAEASRLVRVYAPAILRVADALERRAVLSGAEVAALVNQPRPPAARAAAEAPTDPARAGQEGL
jgi:hypothetical protein